MIFLWQYSPSAAPKSQLTTMSAPSSLGSSVPPLYLLCSTRTFERALKHLYLYNLYPYFNQNVNNFIQDMLAHVDVSRFTEPQFDI